MVGASDCRVNSDLNGEQTAAAIAKSRRIGL